MLALASATCCSGTAACLCAHDSPCTHISLPPRHSSTQTLFNQFATHKPAARRQQQRLQLRLTTSAAFAAAPTATATRTTTTTMMAKHWRAGYATLFDAEDTLITSGCNLHQSPLWMTPATLRQMHTQIDLAPPPVCTYTKWATYPTRGSSSTTNWTEALLRLALACKPCTPPAPALPLHCSRDCACTRDAWIHMGLPSTEATRKREREGQAVSTCSLVRVDCGGGEVYPQPGTAQHGTFRQSPHKQQPKTFTHCHIVVSPATLTMMAIHLTTTCQCKHSGPGTALDQP